MSRYYEYDYDNNIIIGFGSDIIEDEYSQNYIPSATSSQSGASPSNSYTDLKQLCTDTLPDLNEEMYILPVTDTSKLVPYNVYEPFLLVSDMIRQQQSKRKKARRTKAITYSDDFDTVNCDSNLYIDRGLKQSIDCKSVQRLDDFNGSYYNAFGAHSIGKGQCHTWRFQILGNSPAILGITECGKGNIKDMNGAYFGCDSSKSAYSFNTITAKTYNSELRQQPIYQQMLQSGILDQPMIIDMKLDLCKGTMTIANHTFDSQHCGKEILLFDNINTNKSYKLAIALLGSETMNLF